VFTFKNKVISSLFIFAIGFSGWSIFHSNKSTGSLATDTLPRPDAFMENVIATVMNKEGTPKLKIETPKMVHYAEHDNTHLTTPHVTLFRNSPNPWYIDSDFADATRGTEQIRFANHVVIHHPADRANPNTHMETATLTIFPNKQIAETDQPVTITQPDTTIHAIGMLTNLADGTVKLLSQARSEYAPKS
jgi:lipopolysaccharide export system protein LptC